MTEEIRRLKEIVYFQSTQVLRFLDLEQPAKAEFMCRELKENAHRLSNALYALQRRSGEVK